MNTVDFIFIALLALSYQIIERYCVTPRNFFVYYLLVSILVCTTILP